MIKMQKDLANDHSIHHTKYMKANFDSNGGNMKTTYFSPDQDKTVEFEAYQVAEHRYVIMCFDNGILQWTKGFQSYNEYETHWIEVKRAWN